jgi:hypothetical protein
MGGVVWQIDSSSLGLDMRRRMGYTLFLGGRPIKARQRSIQLSAFVNFIYYLDKEASMKRARLFLSFLAVYGLGLGAAGAGPITHGPITSVTVVPGASCEPTCSRAITDSRAFVDVPGASAEITVKKKSVLIARFASDSFCVAQFRVSPNEPLSPGWCSVRILASVGPGGNFVEMDPVMSRFEVFQVHEGEGAHAIERSFEPVSPGTYTVKVQFSIPFGIEPGATFALTGWHLTVEGAHSH